MSEPLLLNFDADEAPHLGAGRGEIEMLYRVDYVPAVQLAGVIAGFLLGERAGQIAAPRLARTYYIAVAALLALGSGLCLDSFRRRAASLCARHGRSLKAVYGEFLDLNRAEEMKGNAPPTNYYRVLCVLGNDVLSCLDTYRWEWSPVDSAVGGFRFVYCGRL